MCANIILNLKLHFLRNVACLDLKKSFSCRIECFYNSDQSWINCPQKVPPSVFCKVLNKPLGTANDMPD